MALSDYQTENNWEELSNASKVNVLSTYVIDLEYKVERLENKVDQLDHDIDVIDS